MDFLTQNTQTICTSLCAQDQPCRTCAVAAWLFVDFCHRYGLTAEFVSHVLPHYWWNDFGLMPGLRSEATILCSTTFVPVRQLLKEPMGGGPPRTHVGEQLTQLGLEAPYVHCHGKDCQEWRPEGALFNGDKLCGGCVRAAANPRPPAVRRDPAIRTNDNAPFPGVGLMPELIAQSPPTDDDPVSRMAKDYFRCPHYAVSYNYQSFQCLLCRHGRWTKMIPRDDHELTEQHRAAVKMHYGRNARQMMPLVAAMNSHLMHEPYVPGRPVAWPFRVHPDYPPYEEPKYLSEGGVSSGSVDAVQVVSQVPMRTEREVLRTWKPGDKVWQCSSPGCPVQLRANCPQCATSSGALLARVFGWTRTKSPDKVYCIKHNGLDWPGTLDSHDKAVVCTPCWITSISHLARYNLQRLAQIADGPEEVVAPGPRAARHQCARTPDLLEEAADDEEQVEVIRSLTTMPGASGGVCDLVLEDPESRYGYQQDCACVVRYPVDGSTWWSKRDSQLTRMTEDEIRQGAKRVEESARDQEIRLYNSVDEQRSLRRKLGVNHPVDGRGRAGDDRPLTTVARICANPECHNVLPYNWPTACHACGSYVALADVDCRGWPQRSDCQSRPDLATLDITHVAMAKPHETALDVIQDLHEFYADHVSKCVLGHNGNRFQNGGGPRGSLPDETVVDDWTSSGGVRLRRTCPSW